MKLNETRPNIETSGGMEEQFFSIQDQGMIFDILRNKMYSNPVLAICREITCNARDAHREVGKQKDPIQITLPNTLDPFYRIKDWGPGISPDRMSNIFIKYTASTKRTDNLQTGGFGLGAKTPFSYSDTFTIETVHDGKKYNYACVIDETKVGKIMPMGEEKTDLPNGTEIIIPVKGPDFKLFKEHTEYVTRHWDVHPTIKGGTIDFKTLKFSLSGNGWGIGQDVNYYGNKEIKLIIDGIEYPLDAKQLKGSSTRVLNSVNGCTYLYFNVGELSLSANREAVHLDKPTHDKITEKLDTIIDDFKKTVQAKIDTLDSLWDANIFYKDKLPTMFYDPTFLGKLKWQGLDMTNYHLIVSPSDAIITEFYTNRYARKGTDPAAALSNHKPGYVQFRTDSKLFINDVGISDVANKYVAQAFTDDTKLYTAQVITPVGKTTWVDLNKKYHFDQMKPGNLSAINPTTKKFTVAGVRMLVFKFNEAKKSFKQVAIDSMESDTNKKVICYLERDTYNATRRVILKNKKYVDNETLSSILDKTDDFSIYGVDMTVPKDKVKENFVDFQSIETFIDEQVFADKNINYVEIKYAKQNQNYFSKTFGYDNYLADYKKKILNKESVFLKTLELQDYLKTVAQKEAGLLVAYESFKNVVSDAEITKWKKEHPNKDLVASNKKLSDTYPLLGHVDYYYAKTVAEPLIHYINLIDGANVTEKAVEITK